ncbi:MAG: glycoside hydrolase family 5 protein [Anaerolineales bacterium]|nr:glycoside hydrolase family 5 protein [Anaerolineales bacterium]
MKRKRHAIFFLFLFLLLTFVLVWYGFSQLPITQRASVSGMRSSPSVLHTAPQNVFLLTPSLNFIIVNSTPSVTSFQQEGTSETLSGDQTRVSPTKLTPTRWLTATNTRLRRPTLSPTRSATPTNPPPALSAAAAVQRMRRGVNMGNTLEAPNEGEWGYRIERRHFQVIRAAGFDAVRIPTRWSAHAQLEAPYTIDPAFFARLDEVIGWALEENLVVVLNIHHYEEMATNPVAHRERFLALWRQIAERYRNYPPTLLFELMNEPNGALTAPLWNEFVRQGVAVIRESNPTRNIIIGGVSWNSYDQLQFLELPNDRHLIATFHYYLPFPFTHQGAEWIDGSDAWLGTPWSGTEEEQNEISHHFDMVENWSRTHNVPIYLGEFGAYHRADMESRVRWTRYVREQAEARGFAWSYWEFGAGFGIYDRDSGQWREDLLRALLP